MSGTFNLAVTVIGPKDEVARDLEIHADRSHTVAELATTVAGYFGCLEVDEAGRRLTYDLYVQRTGTWLDGDSPLVEVDLLEGDLLTLLPPGASET